MQTSRCYIDLKRYDLATSAADLNTRLATLLVTAEIAPWQTTYDEMVRNCWNDINPSMEVLFKQGYSSWLILAGANLSFEKRASYKDFSLMNAMRKLELNPVDTIERDYKHNTKIRAVGLYKVKISDIVKSLVFLSRNSWAMMILTKKNRLELESSLDRLYYAADLSKTEHGLALNWKKVAYENVLLGEVIITVFGSADDKHRSIVVVFSRDADVADLFGVNRETSE